MRDMDDADAARQASRNSSIVAADTAKNYTLVNDGAGGFRKSTSVGEVLDYGDERMANVYRKMAATSFETSTIVAWAPKSILREIPDFYPVLDEDGNEVGRRSRWVIDDPKEFKKWLDETVGYLSDDVLPGGHDAVHAVVVNLDETVPHVHVVCDPFAPDPKHPGKLRTEAQQAWGQHRDVTEQRTDENGKVRTVQITGATKMRRYQQGYREHLLSRGFQIERDVNPEGTSLDKSAFRTLDSRKIAVEAQAAEVQNTAVMVEEMHDINRDEAAVVRGKLVKQAKTIKAERETWNDTERPALVAAARAEGHAEGVAAGTAEVQQLRDAAAVDREAAARDRRAAQQARERVDEKMDAYEAERLGRVDANVEKYKNQRRDEVDADVGDYSKWLKEQREVIAGRYIKQFPAAIHDVLTEVREEGRPTLWDYATRRAAQQYDERYGHGGAKLSRDEFLTETLDQRHERYQRHREASSAILADAQRKLSAAGAESKRKSQDRGHGLEM